MSNPATLRPFVKGDPRFKTRKSTVHKGPYLTPLLKKYLNKQISVPDPTNPEGGKVKMTVMDAIVWRRIFNATEGDDLAIERIFDRMDGKVPNIIKDKTQDEELLNSEFEIIPNGDKPAAIEKFKRFLS